ncbi:MAG TPA: cytochrome c [Usitatibacter sp.]|nr:cytochrome c [Usitatibacter sp.]
MTSLRFLLAAALFTAAFPVLADGDPAVGEKLVQAKGCDLCHERQNLHGAKAIYLRPNRKVKSLDELRAQVSSCNHGMHLELSPRDERDIVAYLNRDYYHFR